MFMVFWWTGRGYLAFVIVFAMCMVFGIAGQAIAPGITDRLPFWGVVLIFSAPVVWTAGTRINHARLAKVRPVGWARLFYRARHKAFSLPMETIALPVALFGVALVVAGLTR